MDKFLVVVAESGMDWYYGPYDSYDEARKAAPKCAEGQPWKIRRCWTPEHTLNKWRDAFRKAQQNQ